MYVLPVLVVALHIVGCTVSEASKNVKCNTTVLRPRGNYAFNCLGLTSIQRYMEKAPSNTTDISIVNSKITVIPPYSFVKFMTTLEVLELRNCGIKTIEFEGLTRLYQLRKLILAENNLERVTGEWFKDISGLQELDVSFNNIKSIDVNFYSYVPYLQVFYFDYNQLETIDYSMLAPLVYLKKVKLGHNPWIWGYRVRLTRQLDNQKVDYQDDWEEWGWMSSIGRECGGNEADYIPNNTTLDCVISKLLKMEIGNGHTISSAETQKIASESRCFNEATALVRCSMISVPFGESMRRTLADLSSTLKRMDPSGAKFKSIL